MAINLKRPNLSELEITIEAREDLSKDSDGNTNRNTFLHEILDILGERPETLAQCMIDADTILYHYWGSDGKTDTKSIREWIEKNSTNKNSSLFRPAFFISLIELAGYRALNESLSRHLASVGSTGGKAKNKPKEELKAWALKQPESSKMPAREAAKYLSAKIPEHLADASTNAEQLIYRALLARHRVK